MMQFLRALFDKSPIEPGSIWEFQDENPWRRWTVRVIETREGWVRYALSDSASAGESYLEASRFRYCYRRVEQ
jgi:hypothetical protein